MNVIKTEIPEVLIIEPQVYSDERGYFFESFNQKKHQEIGLKGVAHITGGGIAGNLVRIIPKGLGANVDKKSIKVLPIFTLIQKAGNVADEAMYEAMNMGVGMILVVEEKTSKKVLREAEGSYVIGKIVKGNGVTVA